MTSHSADRQHALLLGSMMDILVCGKSGQLAKALAREPKGFQWHFAGRDELDLADAESMERTLTRYNFDLLINAAAYTQVDAAEQESDRAMAINGEAPGILAELCERKGAALMHFSTDYVFGNERNTPALEDDSLAPLGVYGLSKLHGEEALRAACSKHFIVRTSWLYGVDGKNFVKTMLQLAGSRKQLNVVYDQIGSPTFVDDLARACLSMAEHYEQRREGSAFGTYHFSNEGVASWYDFAEAIFAMSGVDIELQPVRSSAFPTPAQRPPYSVLDKQKIKDTFGVSIRHWRLALADCLDKLKMPGHED